MYSSVRRDRAAARSLCSASRVPRSVAYCSCHSCRSIRVRRLRTGPWYVTPSASCVSAAAPGPPILIIIFADGVAAFAPPLPLAGVAGAAVVVDDDDDDDHGYSGRGGACRGCPRGGARGPGVGVFCEARGGEVGGLPVTVMKSLGLGVVRPPTGGRMLFSSSGAMTWKEGRREAREADRASDDGVPMR